MKKLVITCKYDGKKEFVSYKTTPGAPAVVETVPFHKATLFDKPEVVEGIIRDFDLPEPGISVVDVNYNRQIDGETDKYSVFLSMAQERAIADRERPAVKPCSEDGILYQLYLFSMLWHGRNPELEMLEYDHAFESIKKDYAEFMSSEFNNPSVSLYEAIEAYFDDKLATETRVFFRKVIENPMAGAVIAVFPDIPADEKGNPTSYMFIGQHSAATYKFFVEDTVSTKSGCDVYGCMEEHLRDIVGYDDLVVCEDPQEIGFMPKCLYCDCGNSPTHFICESCGDGMCDECYDADKEHDAHYQDPAQSADGEEQYLLMDDVFGGGYGCDSCVGKALKMEKNMEIEL